MTKSVQQLEILAIKSVLNTIDNGKLILCLPLPTLIKNKLIKKHKENCMEIFLKMWTNCKGLKPVCYDCHSPRLPSYEYKHFPHIHKDSWAKISNNYKCVLCNCSCIIDEGACMCFDYEEN